VCYKWKQRQLQLFWNVVIATGLKSLVKINYNIIDHGVNTAFCERQHP
jgi:hypothetical protein